MTTRGCAIGLLTILVGGFVLVVVPFLLLADTAPDANHNPSHVFFKAGVQRHSCHRRQLNVTQRYVAVLSTTEPHQAWVTMLPPSIGHITFSSHEPKHLPDGVGPVVRTRCGAGREASSYLQFIIDNFDCLPDVVAVRV